MISGHANIDAAVQATKLGALDFLEKPLSLEKVLIIIKRALERQHLEKENKELRNNLFRKQEIIGENPRMKVLKRYCKGCCISEQGFYIRRKRNRKRTHRTGSA
jgi:two-component system nitrogen regulation response regulator NtrX